MFLAVLKALICSPSITIPLSEKECAKQIGAFCITGCGNKQSCETPKCGSEDFGAGTAIGCSIPGCGGCLTSGEGCNAACWPQACKIVHASAKEKDEETGEKAIAKITACDTRYYDGGGCCGGCFGCNQKEKNCYTGCIKIKNSSDNMSGFFYSTDLTKRRVMLIF